MKPFILLLLLIVTGILFEVLFRPFRRLDALCQRFSGSFRDLRRNTLPATGRFGSFRRPLADDAWHPATQF